MAQPDFADETEAQMNQKDKPVFPLSVIVSRIVEEFEQLPTLDEKYSRLFELGSALPLMDEALKVDENLVRGCQSTLWFYLDCSDGRCSLQADSDSMLIKGISAMLVRLVEGRTIEEIREINLDFLDRIGLWKMASRANPGLKAIVAHLRESSLRGAQTRE